VITYTSINAYYFSQGICVKERHDLNCDGVEMLWIEELIPNFKLLVCVVYRPPGTTESFLRGLHVCIAKLYAYMFF
jgi:hypothetical protein